MFWMIKLCQIKTYSEWKYKRPKKSPDSYEGYIKEQQEYINMILKVHLKHAASDTAAGIVPDGQSNRILKP